MTTQLITGFYSRCISIMKNFYRDIESIPWVLFETKSFAGLDLAGNWRMILDDHMELITNVTNMRNDLLEVHPTAEMRVICSTFLKMLETLNEKEIILWQYQSSAVDFITPLDTYEFNVTPINEGITDCTKDDPYSYFDNSSTMLYKVYMRYPSQTTDFFTQTLESDIDKK